LKPGRLAGLLGGAALLVLVLSMAARPAQNPGPDPGVSRAAADSCAKKVKGLQDFAAAPAKKSLETTLSQDEINSYLALELSPSYHPSLKSLVMRFEEDRLQGVALVDFDKLGMNAKGLARLFAGLLSGTHTLTMKGKLRTEGGKGSFVLDEAQFDGTTLPNFLVEQIISAVGSRQKPPFDPVQPTQMPWGIKTVDVHAGRIVVHQ
jgi:hypothetical protein